MPICYIVTKIQADTSKPVASMKVLQDNCMSGFPTHIWQLCTNSSRPTTSVAAQSVAGMSFSTLEELGSSALFQ